MDLLKNKSGLVIGASSGIGHAAGLLFAEEKAKIALVARRREKLSELVREIESNGGQAIAIQADITVASDHRRIVQETISAFGRLDFAFNNAGTIGNFVPMLEQSEADWDTTIDTNLKAI